MIFNLDKLFGQKSMQGTSSYSSTNTIMPSKIEISNDRLALMQLNNGIAYACAMKISNFLSAVPLHVYAKVPKDSKLITEHKYLSKKELKALKIIKKGIIKEETNTQIVELLDHPLIDLLHRPNEYMSWADWIIILETYLSILGNAYFLIEKEGNTIKALHPLLAEFIWTITDAEGKVLRYEYYPTSQEYKSKIYTPEDIIHFKSPSAGSIQSGRGWMEACQKEIRLLEEANNHQIALAANMGQPGCIVTIKGKVGSKDEANDVSREFVSKWSKLRRGQPLVSFSQNDKDGISITPYGQSIKDMAYTENQPYLRSVICATAGVPEDLVHSDNSNRASSVTAMQSFLSFTICPRLNGVVEQLNHRIAPYYDDNIFIGYDNSELIASDPTTQSNVLKTYVDAKIMTINEARTILDLPLIEEDIKEDKEVEVTNEETK